MSEQDAENIKILYGLDKRKMKFDYAVYESQVGEEKRSYSVEALNEIIEKELENFVKMLNVALEQLSNIYNITNSKSLPVILVGGGAKLKGMKAYLSNQLANSNIDLLKIKSIGARDLSLVSLLGAIYVNKRYSMASGGQGENRVTVNREE